MQKNLLAKFRAHGHCKNGMDPVTTNVTPKTRDDLIYTIEEGEYELYKVVEIQEDGNYQCRKFNISPQVLLAAPRSGFPLHAIYWRKSEKWNDFDIGIHC